MANDSEKKRYVIDTNAFRPPTSNKSKLVVHKGGEPIIEQDARSILSQHSLLFIELENFTKCHDVVFLPEVIAENERFIKHLLNQKDFLERLKLEEDSQELAQRLAFARNIGHYAKHLMAFNSYFGRRTFDVEELNSLQKSLYQQSLDKAVRIHQIFDSKPFGSNFGDMIDTDRKLIASVLAISLRYPVTIISRDERIVGDMEKGQRGSLEKVIEALNIGERRRTSINVNPQDISVYNPKYSDNGFYDSSKERVVYERRK